MADRDFALTTPLDPEVLRFAALAGEDEVSALFAYSLTAVSEDPEIDPARLLGQPVTVTVGADGPRRHLSALVASFGFLDVAGSYARYRATLRPALWLLSLTTDNRIFQNLSVVEIVEEVLGAYPLVRWEKRLRRSYPPREYCVQYGESDLDFVQRLLDHEGIAYHHEHDEAGHLLVLSDDGRAFAPVEGIETLPWQPDERASFRDGDVVVAWSAASSIRTGAYAHTDYNFEKPSLNLMAKAKAEPAFEGDRSEHYRYPGTYTMLARGDSLASLRLDEGQSARRRATARATAPGLRPGATFKLEGFPRTAENGEWLVLRARHRMWDGQYQSGLAADGAAGAPQGDTGCEVEVDLQPADLRFRPERRVPHPRMKGPQTAVVVGPPGEEIFTDKHARVKVRFRWDRLGRGDQDSSCFIRVSAAWAGAGWGFVQVPRIGQEVIVDFLEGDPDQPIITGRVYNADAMPPYGLPGSATQSGWKSNSSPGGGGWNELRFEDKKGAEEVYFQAEKDHNELVKNDETRNVGHDWKEDVGHDATQSIGNDRTESVGHDKSTSVGNNRSVDIGANDSEHVGRNRSLTVDGNETIHVVGNSTESIDGNHTQTVRIAQAVTVMAGRTDTVLLVEARSVGSHQTTSVGGNRSVSVGGSQTHAVTGSDATSVAGGQTLRVAKDQGTDVSGGRKVKVGKDQGHDVTGKVLLKSGKEITIEAADRIILKAGDASIELKKDGTVSIKGKDVTVNGSGKITVKASGDMVLKGSKIHAN